MKTYVAFLGLLITVFSFFNQEVSHANETSANSINIAISTSPTQLSPFFATDANSQNINRLVHSSLTDFNDKMEFVCILCETYNDRSEGDKHIISFKLKKNLSFQDGSKLTSQDVFNSWKYFTDEENVKSIFRFAFKKIENIKIKNELEFELIFDSFSVENLSNLALLKIIKLEKINNNGEMTIVGAGPYSIEEIKPLEIVLTPRDKSKLKLIFKVVKDETTLALKLLNNEIDISVTDLTPRKIAWMKKEDKRLQFHERSSTNYKYISINHLKEKFKDNNIAKAISHLIPRKKIIQYKLKGMGVPATSIYSKDFAGLFVDVPIDNYDPELANAIFVKNGYVKNDQGLWQKDNKIFELDWKSSNNKATEEMANTIKSYLEKNGVKVNLTFQEWGTFMRNFKNGSYDIVIGQWVGFTGGDMIKFAFHSESIPPKGGNRGNFKNTKADHFIDLATTEIDEKTRNNYYRQALRVAFEDYAYINLWHPNIVWISRSCLKGINLYPNGNFYGLLNVEKNCE